MEHIVFSKPKAHESDSEDSSSSINKEEADANDDASINEESEDAKNNEEEKDFVQESDPSDTSSSKSSEKINKIVEGEFEKKSNDEMNQKINKIKEKLDKAAPNNQINKLNPHQSDKTKTSVGPPPARRSHPFASNATGQKQSGNGAFYTRSHKNRKTEFKVTEAMKYIDKNQFRSTSKDSLLKKKTQRK